MSLSEGWVVEGELPGALARSAQQQLEWPHTGTSRTLTPGILADLGWMVGVMVDGADGSLVAV